MADGKEKKLLNALEAAIEALDQAPDWKLLEHPGYERWYKGPRAAALELRPDKGK